MVAAGVLLIGWLLGVLGVYDAGALVHLLLAGAIVAGAAAFTRPFTNAK